MRKTKFNASTVTVRSVNSLQWFYAIVLSLSVVQAVKGIIEVNTTNLNIIFNLSSLPQFFSFIAILIPFYQGANRYLDDTYIRKKNHMNPLAGLIDFFFFFVEALVFYCMALLIFKPEAFYIGVLAVLFIDVIWLIYVYFANKEIFKEIKCWLGINTITFIILIIVLICPLIDNDIKKWLSMVVLIIRTIIDYWLVWPFYWPAFDSINFKKH